MEFQMKKLQMQTDKHFAAEIRAALYGRQMHR